ncbi:DUF4386 family protein [Corynebacterium deserti]|uniref:DUF4386 family protein n=1 Tax=Corynebacterium deserti TaxID=1408191 RepID=UPI002F3E27BD
MICGYCCLAYQSTQQHSAQNPRGITKCPNQQLNLAIFGVHLILIGVLLCLSLKVPTIIGTLAVITGIGYLVDAVALLLGSPNPGIFKFTFVGEVVLFIWLIYSGVTVPKEEKAMLTRL